MSELMDSYAFLNRGRTFEEMPAGFRFRTGRRTITETDLMTFLNTCGFAEPLFYDHDKGPDAHFDGLVCPGALTYSIAEGLVVQTSVLMGTGMAFLHMELDVRKPVFAGDTIWVGVEITESRPTSKPGRGLVSARNTVYNQREEEVLVYTPVRLVRGRSPS